MTYKESCDEWNDTAIRMEAVGDRTHTVLTNTITDISALIAAEARVLRLEVNHRLRAGEVAARQVGGTTHQFRKNGDDGGENDFGQLAGRLRRVCRLVHRQVLLPALRKLARNTTSELGVLNGELLAIGGEESIPLGLELSAASSHLNIRSVCLLRYVERLVRGQTKLALQSLNIVRLEGCVAREHTCSRQYVMDNLRAP